MSELHTANGLRTAASISIALLIAGIQQTQAVDQTYSEVFVSGE